MANIRQTFLTLFIISLLVGLNASPYHAMSFKAEQYSAPFTQTNAALTGRQRHEEIPETYELVAENAVFQLYANPATIAFKVVDKRSGYIWNSNLDEVTQEDRLNRTWTAFAQSGISIDFMDRQATSKRASITNAEHTLDFTRNSQGFSATITFTEPSITLVVTVGLEPTGVVVDIPFESIKQENADFKLGLLYVYPFLGATKEDSVPGYMFIPDGSGSLIRFAATTKAKNMFYGRYYGSDLGMITVLPFDPTVNRPYKISIPVYGMAHGNKQNAYISIVEKGASYGEIQAHPAGITTKFNFILNVFLYNESYFQATNRSGAGVTTLQPTTNAFDVKIHYRFLTGVDGDYVGMARSYQQYLVEKGALKKIEDPGPDIGIRLEFLGGEKEKVLFWNRLISMTTVEQMSEILKGLDVKNPQVIYYGWQPLGASSMPPKSLKIDSRLGTKNQLLTLIEEINTGGGNFYLYLDPQAALRDEKGYSQQRDLAMSITNSNLLGYNRNKVNHYLNYEAIDGHFSKLSQEVFAELNAGLALEGIGSMLYSDFKRNNFLNRENAIQMYQGLFDRKNGKTSFYLPNDYMFGYMDAYFDIPLTNSGYLYTTDSVPFIEIVLSGYVPYYGKAMNFSSNTQDDLLRHVDFSVYPSYFLTHEITAKILKTSSSWIYTSSYTQWSKEIGQTYQRLNNLLGPVKGQSMVAREILAPGVSATTYANGKQIIVNYNNRPYTAGSLVINGKDAVIREVTP